MDLAHIPGPVLHEPLPVPAHRIDAHQHFWRYSAVEYGWIDEAMAEIRRDFLPADLEGALAAGRIEGTVAVQARQSVVETDWLLDLSRQFPWIKGVVGWVPLAQEGEAVGALLDRYCTHPRFKGVRHVLQAEPDAYFTHPGFNDAMREVADHDLTYDLLLVERQLPHAIALVDRHPSLVFVVDHLAKPVIRGGPSPLWREHIRELARRPQVHCKFSGIVTEVPGWQWSAALLRPYFEVVLEAFGARRLMFGSDWPVCLVATTHERWLAAVEALVQPLSASERAAILGETATDVYRLHTWSPPA